MNLEMDVVKVTGTFNADAFFQTLAAILSRKYGKEITVTVTPKLSKEEQEAERVSA